MKIEFVGAARTVTGSSYIVKSEDFTIMVDCGMFQGTEELRKRNHLQLIYAADQIEALVLTHAHIDHSGLIPKLVHDGFKGPIFATKATCDLLKVMLPDSAHIQQMDAEFINKKNRKIDKPFVDPLYTEEDAYRSIERLVPVSYGDYFQVVPAVRARFRDAGHILGSSFIEMEATEKGKTKRIVFSGDLGPNDQALLRDAEVFEGADVLLIESTYGDRLHKSKNDTYNEFKDIINSTHNRSGNIVIPSFAVERTQEIIYQLSKLIKSKEVPPIPVYIDSPLAVSATEIFRNNIDCFDDETKKLFDQGNSPLDFPSLKFVRTKEESKNLTLNAKGSIIISASGMCSAGRIKYHLQNNLYKPQSSVIFVGYQAQGTLGRMLVEGIRRVKIYGDDVLVNASVFTLGGFSGHADRDRLLSWVSTGITKDTLVFVVHGEESASENLSKEIRDRFGATTMVPLWGEIIDLDTLELSAAKYGDMAAIEDEYYESGAVDLEEAFQELMTTYRKALAAKRPVRQTMHELEDLKAMIRMISGEM